MKIDVNMKTYPYPGLVGRSQRVSSTKEITDVDVYIVQRARDMIANPDHWCQGSMARDARDKPTCAVRYATKHCAWGALYTSGQPMNVDHLFVGLCKKAVELYGQNRDLVGVNDVMGHAAVMKVFDAWLTEHAPQQSKSSLKATLPVLDEEERELTTA
jgi:hypothetical protein